MLPIFHFDAGPDPAFLFDADPDPVTVYNIVHYVYIFVAVGLARG